MQSSISKNSYEKIFEMSIDMICIAHFNGYFININPSFIKTLGYSKAELLSKPFIEFVHPDDREKTINEISSLKEGGSSFQFDNRYQHADGHYLCFSWSASVDINEGYIYALARDVTQSETMKSKLKQIDKALTDKSIIALTDAKGVIVEVNNNFCDISGYSRQELVGKTHKIVNSGHHSKEFFNKLWQTISSGSIWSGTIKNKNKNGSFYFVASIITPIFDIENNIVNYLAIRHDVTETINNADKLSNTWKILNEMGTIAKVGGWQLTIATGELTWTDETFNILEVEQRYGQKPMLKEGLSLFIPKHQKIIENSVKRAIEFGESYNHEVKALTGKGNERWIFTNGKANYENGKIVSISGTIQDIDARKVDEEKYEQERQKAIKNAKLASLGELAASIAHEINNPLAIVSAYSEALLMLPYQKNAMDSKLETIVKSTERIAHIVSGLQKFSRTSGENKKNSLCLSSIVNEALSLTKPKLNRHSVELIKDIPLNCMVYANEIEIEQVVINLINNAVDAIKFMLNKWIKIIVIETESTIQLKIIDSGKGIPDNTQEKIFEPFFTSKGTGEGTGLGLSITKGILDDHDAEIRLDNKSDYTCFIIDFPKCGEE